MIANIYKFMFLAILITKVRLDHQRWRNFRCSDGDFIPSSSFCDGRNDCEDGVDEEIGCDKENCGSGRFKCGDGSCMNLTIRCNSIRDCGDGTDEVNCVSSKNVLLYKKGSEIEVRNFTSNETTLIGNDSSLCQALTAAHNYYHYASINPTVLYKISFEPFEKNEINVGLTEIKSIAVDWITNNTYLSTEESIYVAQPHEMIGIKLKNCVGCFMALAPRYGLMFWSNNTDILQSNMDGSDEKVFVKKAFTRPYLITIDEGTDGVYWFDDDRGALMFKDFFAKEPGEIVWKLPSDEVSSSIQNFSNVFTVFENKLLFAGQNSTKAEGVDLNNGRVIYDINNEAGNPFISLFAYNPLLQRMKFPNPWLIESCDGLFLLRPGTYPKTLNYSCISCKKSSNDNSLHWCENNAENTLIPKLSHKSPRLFLSLVVSAVVLIGVVVVLVMASVVCIFFIIRRRRNSQVSRRNGNIYQLGQSY